RTLRTTGARSRPHTWKGCASAPATGTPQIPMSGSCRTKSSNWPPKKARHAVRRRYAQGLRRRPLRATRRAADKDRRCRQFRPYGESVLILEAHNKSPASANFTHHLARLVALRYGSLEAGVRGPYLLVTVSPGDRDRTHLRP